MEPMLALAAVRSVASIVASLAQSVAPAPSRAPVRASAPRPTGPFARAASRAASFESVLSSEIGRQGAGAGALGFSPAAVQRMEAMGIRLSQAQYERLMAGVRDAAAKGSQNALVMMDGMAFTVDVREGLVTDVSNRNRIDNRVYTKIDTVVETKI